jgi:hypothetical protein
VAAGRLNRPGAEEIGDKHQVPAFYVWLAEGRRVDSPRPPSEECRMNRAPGWVRLVANTAKLPRPTSRPKTLISDQDCRPQANFCFVDI